MKAILRYPGAKWAIADWVITHFPEHRSYLEPFFGSGAVFFKKAKSSIETINDLDGEIANLFECIRSDPERIAKDIYFTPYSRQVYELAYQHAPTDPFERARNFFIRCNMGYGYRTNGHKVGWKNDIQGRERSYAAEYWKGLPIDIAEAADRLRGVQIENKPAVELIERFNYSNVLIYCDPPYLLETRHAKQYRHEMEEQDHRNLLDALLAHRGSVILSGYDSRLYNEALGGWHTESVVSMTQSLAKKEEKIWMNFEPEKEQLELII